MSTLTRLRASGKAALGATTSALLLAGGLLAVPAVAHAADEAPEEGTVTEATLDWGVKSSFVNYLQSPFAGGEISTLGSTERSGSEFQWSGGHGKATTDGSAINVSFGAGNGVHFTGHDNALDLTFTNPRIEINNEVGTLYLDVKSRELAGMGSNSENYFEKTDAPVADLTLSEPVVEDGAISWNEVQATLTAIGSQAFGGQYEEGEALDPLSFSLSVTAIEEEPEPVADPKVTVTPSENLDPSVDNTLTIEGEGYVGDAADQGVYVLFGETNIWSGDGPLVADGWVALEWVRANQIVDGSFSLELDVPAGKLDPAKEYHVATSAAHALSATDRSLDAFASVTVLQEEEPEAPEETEPAVTIEELKNGEVRQGEELTFVGTGFTKGDLVTVTVNSDPVVVAEDVEADDNGEVSVPWTVPADFALGAHTVVLALNGEDVAEAGFSVVEAVATGGNTGAEGEGDTNAETTVGDEGQDGDKLANTGAEATAVFVLAGLSLLVGTGAMLSRLRKAKLDI